MSIPRSLIARVLLTSIFAGALAGFALGKLMHPAVAIARSVSP
jgi:hypothetical protein